VGRENIGRRFFYSSIMTVILDRKDGKNLQENREIPQKSKDVKILDFLIRTAAFWSLAAMSVSLKKFLFYS